MSHFPKVKENQRLRRAYGVLSQGACALTEKLGKRGISGWKLGDRQLHAEGGTTTGIIIGKDVAVVSADNLIGDI
jgi:hypothetical protein